VPDVAIWLSETIADTSPETVWWCFYNAGDLSEETNGNHVQDLQSSFNYAMLGNDNTETEGTTEKTDEFSENHRWNVISNLIITL
jgi:hypothetical protein